MDEDIQHFNLRLCEMFGLDPDFVRDIKLITSPTGLVYTATMYEAGSGGEKHLNRLRDGPAFYKLRGAWGGRQLPEPLDRGIERIPDDIQPDDSMEGL